MLISKPIKNHKRREKMHKIAAENAAMQKTKPIGNLLARS